LYYLHDLGHLTHLGINPFKAPVIRPHLTPIGIPMGILLAFAFHHEASHRRLRTVLGWKGASLVALALLVGVLHLQKHDEWWGMLPLAMALLVGACVLREDHRLAPILGSRPLVFVGKISYGMYLFHMLVISLVCRVAGSYVPPDSVRLFLVALPLTIAAAAVSYRYFETPFLKVKDRFKR
jgi:peptidoglycan/LPS O-acetylase OafA/YrhL